MAGSERRANLTTTDIDGTARVWYHGDTMTTETSMTDMAEETSGFRPRVFVTQYSPKLAFAEANDYGEVVFLTDKEFRPMPCPRGTNDIVKHEIVKEMSEYVPGKDYIVLTGSAIPNLYVGALIAKHSPAVHRVLKWDNRTKTYELFMIEI